MMTKDKLDKLIGDAIERRRLLAEQKGKEYTQGNPDRLANFRGAANAIDAQLKDDLVDEQRMFAVWQIFFGKHYDAVKSFFKHGREFSSEGIEGRIDDMQVYLDLLRGIVAELKERKNAPANNSGKDLHCRAVVHKRANGRSGKNRKTLHRKGVVHLLPQSRAHFD
jgi:hypothetical protein